MASGCPHLSPGGDGVTTLPRPPCSDGHGASPSVPKVGMRGPQRTDTPGGVAMGCPQGGDEGTTLARAPQSSGHGVSPRWGWGDHGAQIPLEGWPWGAPRVRMGWPHWPGTPEPWPWGVPICPQGKEEGTTAHRYPWRSGRGVAPMCPQGGDGGDHGVQGSLEQWLWGVPKMGMGGPRCPDTPGGVAMGCPQGEDGVATLARDPRAVAMGCPQSGDGGTTVSRSPRAMAMGCPHLSPR